MKSNLKPFLTKFFSRELDFRVRLFNVLAIAGAGISIATFLLSAATTMWANAAVSGVLAALSLGLLLFTSRTGRYQLGYGITIVTIFMIAFPVMFFTSGGYRSGMPAVFLFAVTFTVLMLEGKRALLVSLLEIAEYIAVCVFAYFHPQYVTHFETEAQVLTDILFAFSAVSIAVGIVLYLHLKEYTRQRELLQEQNERLRRYDASRSTFLTTVSHEIKNPLNAINLHARDTVELMEETPLDLDLMRENQAVIKKMVSRIDNILMDLKDTVAIEQGRLSLSLAPMRLDKLLREASETYFGKNYTAGNRLILKLAEDVPPITADYARITQVVTNLLSNALQHTKNGDITVLLSLSQGEQFVRVSDTGTGMSPEMQEKAFEGYVSASEDYWRHGIGLYVCHQIVTAHGGRIWIESEPGKGTTVSFVLPNGREQDGI